jgi:AraC-like DNA-binding protein
MNPDLEVVQIGEGQSFKAWAHGYPFHTVRWHFHPEYEIHHVVATNGRYFVGDYIGQFEPGNLVLTGPNLPDVQIPLRGRVVQFSETFIADVMKMFPELTAFKPVLELSRKGALFSKTTASLIGQLLEELVEAQGVRRIELFMNVIGAMSRCTKLQALTSAAYLPDPSGFMANGINEALAYINKHLTEQFSETDLAAISGRSASSFSRSFRRHTGMALVQYVNRLRINLACQLLMNNEQMTITDICFEVGFNNISNFNRQFLMLKGMAPSRFKGLLNENIRTAKAA